MRTFARTLGLLALIACMTWTASPASAFGVIPGETGTTFDFTASAERIEVGRRGADDALRRHGELVLEDSPHIFPSDV